MRLGGAESALGGTDSAFEGAEVTRKASGVIRKPQLYEVEWLDPRAHLDGEIADLDLARVRTVGWLTYEDSERLKLSQEFYTDENASTSTVWRSTTVILKSLVKKRRKLA